MNKTILATLIAIAAGLTLGSVAHAADEPTGAGMKKWESMTPEQKAAAKAKWDAKTPEEKEAAKKQFAEKHPRAAAKMAAKKKEEAAAAATPAPAK